MLFISVDPGLSGGIAVIDSNGNRKAVYSMTPGKGYPEPLLFANEFRRIVGDERFCAAIEQTGTRPGQGIGAAHSYGLGAGMIMGVICALQPVEFRIIRPYVWQKYVWEKYGAHGTDTKQRTYQSMLNAHPEIAAHLTTVRGKLLDGLSDALGICTYLVENSHRR